MIDRIGKYNLDLLINLVCFGFVAVIGVVLNILILKKTDQATLGVFNQIYAIYILLSQLAVGGVHLSVQKFVPEFAATAPTTLPSILISAFGLTAATSVLVIFGAFLLRKVPGQLLDSPGVTACFVYSIPGLFFFSLNKVILAYLNGQRRMRAFAVFQLQRFLIIFALVYWLLYQTTIDPNFLGATLGVAELILFVPLIVFVLKGLGKMSMGAVRDWFGRHSHFSRSAFMGNFLMDINTKVDTFILGVFWNDATVGLYAFVATLVEGLSLLPALFRNNINPIITKLHIKGNPAFLTKILRRNIRFWTKAIGGLILASVVFFGIFLLAIKETNDFSAMMTIYAIMAICMAAASGYLPLQMLFNQVGLPKLQTRFVFYIFACNTALNLLMAPFWGIYGAAIATGTAFLVQIFLTKKLARTQLDLKI